MEQVPDYTSPEELEYLRAEYPDADYDFEAELKQAEESHSIYEYLRDRIDAERKALTWIREPKKRRSPKRW